MLDLDGKGLLVLTRHAHNECIMCNKTHMNSTNIATHGEILHPKGGLHTHETQVVAPFLASKKDGRHWRP